MFPNLRAEMARRGHTHKEVAEKLGMNPKTFSAKMTGRSEFTLSEMLRIKTEYFPDMSLEYLFRPSRDRTA